MDGRRVRLAVVAVAEELARDGCGPGELLRVADVVADVLDAVGWSEAVPLDGVAPFIATAEEVCKVFGAPVCSQALVGLMQTFEPVPDLGLSWVLEEELPLGVTS